MHGGPGHGLLPDRLSGRGRLLHQARRTAPPRRPGLPALRTAASPGGPPLPSRPRGGLPVRPLRPGLQRLHGDLVAGDPSPPRATADDPPRGRPGHPDGADGARAGLRSQGAADPQAPAPGARPHRPGPQPARGRRGRGRRDVPERGGKKASRTPTRTTRRGGAPTIGGAMAPSRRTGRRSPAWSVASRGRSGWT